ncbi:hypothetical protein BofuT4_uP128520.1 [Botrytis cinerea T4]|uniref:Uncharacterized protein n=1 Tax=Botryotinia fuckeliana (strain T4) TaxID=999810 RepID=G2YRA4_BOTF4|nr:hypothetical protein BofuT4_uP128520.1 [Botrytis cinerea T4]
MAIFCILYSWLFMEIYFIANEWSGICESTHESAASRFTLLRARAKTREFYATH